MQNILTNQSIFFRRQTVWLLITFLGIRILSFLLADELFVQSILVFLILMTLGILYFKNPNWAWYIVLGEIFLGGAGHYLEFAGLSIRTLLIGFFLFLWISQSIGQQIIQYRKIQHKQFNYLLLAFFISLIFSTTYGLINNHEFRLVVQDLIPFIFLFLLFPVQHLFTSEKNQEYLTRLIIVFIIGTALFSLVTFFLFSTGITEIHQDFYKWFRDIDIGKITYLGNNFFRIVDPSHLLAVPITLLITSLLMRDEKHHKMWRILLLACILILVLNFSRIYFLALGAGLLILKLKHSWEQWFKESLYVIGMILILFFGLHLTASRGSSLGLDLLTGRIQTVVSPLSETSSATRMILLPNILEKIQAHPILGDGLGSTVTFFNPTTYQKTRTSQFDWGYLEMLVELGIIGSLLLLSLFLWAIYNLYTKIQSIPDWHDFDVGILAGLISFLIMNITSPALFHVFGILFLIFALTIAIKHTTIFDRTTILLYQVFNKLSS